MRKLFWCLLVVAVVITAPVALAANGVVAGAPVVDELAPGGCNAYDQAAFDLSSILPTTVLDQASAFSCPSYFFTANYCYQCWEGYGLCGRTETCYICTELCLGLLNCFIP